MSKATVKTNATRNFVVVTSNDSRKERAEEIVNTVPELGGRKIAVIAIDLLDVDYEYQRVRTPHVNYLTDHFDINECDPLLVSYRDGKFYIIDGQHRFYAALANGIKNLLCIIRMGLTAEEEARVFVKLNTSRKPLKQYEIFKANIRNGNESIPEVKIDMTVKRVCDKYDIKISYDNHPAVPKMLRALTTARGIVKSYGEEALDWLLDTIKSTNWYECKDAYTDTMLAALKSYYSTNTKNIDEAKAKLIKLMTTYSPMDVLAYGNEKYSRHGYGRYARMANAIKDLA